MCSAASADVHRRAVARCGVAERPERPDEPDRRRVGLVVLSNVTASLLLGCGRWCPEAERESELPEAEERGNLTTSTIRHTGTFTST